MPDEADTEAGYYTLPEIATKMRMSERWVRGELDPKKGKGIEHSRPGGRIRMTDEQIEKFKAAYEVAPVATGSITTGRRKSA